MNHARKLPPIRPWKVWPKELLAKEQKTNPRSYQRGFLMRAFSDDEKLFPSFTSCYTPGIMVGQLARGAWPTFVGVDLAGKGRKGTVIFVAAIDPGSQRRFVLEVLRGAWTATQTAEQIRGVVERHRDVRSIMVEDNGYQENLISWIKGTGYHSSFSHLVEGFTTTGSNKHSKTHGVQILEVEFHNKMWVIPGAEFESHSPSDGCGSLGQVHQEWPCGWCAWSSEMKEYPIGATDDCVMAHWFCWNAINQNWFGQGGGGEGLGLGSDFNAR